MASRLFSTFHLCYEEIFRVHPKNNMGTLLLSSGTLSKTLELENFASRSCCQENLSTVELVDHTCVGRRVLAERKLLYYTQFDVML